MVVRLRSWCCELSTLVTVIIIIQTVIYLVLGTLATVLILLPDSYNYLHGQLMTVVIVTLVVSISGLLTNCLLLLGIRLQSHYLLVPWTVHTILLVLGLLGTGTYLGIHFTGIGPQDRTWVLAVGSSAVIVVAVFLILVIILVVQLGSRIQQKLFLVRVTSSIRGSRASINYNYKSNMNNDWSNKSNMNNDRSNKSNIDTPLSGRSNKSVFIHNNSINRSEYQHKHKSNIVTPLSVRSNRSDYSYKLSCNIPTVGERRTHQSQAALDIPRCNEYVPDCSMSNSSMDESLHPELPRHTSPEQYPSLYILHTDTMTTSDSINILPDNNKEVESSNDNSDVTNQFPEEGLVPVPVFPTHRFIPNTQITAL